MKLSRNVALAGLVAFASLCGTGTLLSGTAQAAVISQNALLQGVQERGADTLHMANAQNTKNKAGAPAATNDPAATFVDKMAGDAIAFLGGSMSQTQKKQAFAKLLEQSFDMNTIGRFSLGTYWRQATPQQQQEYLRLFKDYVINIYSQRFQEYNDQRFETRGARKESERDTIVTSAIIDPRSGAQTRVDWRVRERNGKYQIVDVIVEGVSMSVTQRSDFSSVIQRGGGNVDVLLQTLRQ